LMVNTSFGQLVAFTQNVEMWQTVSERYFQKSLTQPTILKSKYVPALEAPENVLGNDVDVDELLRMASFPSLFDQSLFT
jgi:hypothetical protein